MFNDVRPEVAQASDEADLPCSAHPEGGPSAEKVSVRPVAVIAPAGLLKSWRQWTAVVECFALGRRSRRSRDKQAFEMLRKQLLTTFRARAAEAEGPERDFYRGLEELVSPWVSLWSLAREDREILCDLLARCHRVERVLRGRSGSARAWLAAMVLALAAASALLSWIWVVP
jgi:hypothetical protein